MGRRQLFQINLERVDVAPDVDFDVLVAETEGYSGDDICGLCETAKMMPVKRLYTPELLKELQRKRQDGATDEEVQTYEKAALEITWVSARPWKYQDTRWLADWMDGCAQADFQTAMENVCKSVGQDQLERFVKWEQEFGSK